MTQQTHVGRELGRRLRDPRQHLVDRPVDLAGVGLPRGEREGAQIISLADLERAGDERTFRRTAEGRVGSHGRAQARFKLNRTLT